MNRKRLFEEGENAVLPDGKMYDILDTTGGSDMIGAMT
jgi:hypothetical protein